MKSILGLLGLLAAGAAAGGVLGAIAGNGLLGAVIGAGLISSVAFALRPHGGWTFRKDRHG